MQVLLETLNDLVRLFLLLSIEGYGKLERKVALFDSSLGDHLGVLGKDWLGNHGVLGLHESKGCVVAIAVEVSVEMVVIFEEVGKQELCVVVWEFVLDLNEALLRVENKSLESALEVLQVGKVLKGQLDHVSGVIDLLVFIEEVKSLEVLALLVADYCLLCFVVVVSPTETHCLPVSAVAFH